MDQKVSYFLRIIFKTAFLHKVLDALGGIPTLVIISIIHVSLQIYARLASSPGIKCGGGKRPRDPGNELARSENKHRTSAGGVGHRGG